MSKSRSWRLAGVLLVATAAMAGGGLTTPAHAAASVSVDQGKLRVNGGGERNAFFVTGAGGGAFDVTDGAPGASVSAGSGCSKTSASAVTCTGVTVSIVVSAGDGDDFVRLRSTNLPSDIRGGIGNDVLVGSSTARDFIFGEDGNDNLSGSGNDFLNGGNGTDKCSGASDKVRCES